MRRNKKLKKAIMILTIMLISCFLLFQTLRRTLYRITNDFFYPFITTTSHVEMTLADKALSFQSKNKLLSIIKTLKKENKELCVDRILFDKLKSENKTLREHLKIEKESTKKIIHAQIFLADPPFWGASFKIDKGSNAGIKLNDTVVTTIPSKEKLALVGRIIKLSKHTAVVGTIINPSVKFSVLLPDYNILGCLNGGGITDDVFWTNITYLPRDIKYKESSPVFTSGVGLNTPGSIYIGELTKATQGKFTEKEVVNSLYAQVKLTSPVDFTKLHFVMVLTTPKGLQ